jgi:hypothetical protein
LQEINQKPVKDLQNKEYPVDWRRFPVLRERQAKPPPALSPLPDLAEQLPTFTPQSNGHAVGYLDPDM